MNKQCRKWKRGSYLLSFTPNLMVKWPWGGQVSFKALKMLKSLGLRQQEQGGLHSLTWWGFWFEFPMHGSLFDQGSFSSVCLKSACRKVTPSWSQQVWWSDGGWPATICNIQSLSLCTGKKQTKEGCKAIDPVPGHLKTFWWNSPRIPGISRISKAIWFGI